MGLFSFLSSNKQQVEKLENEIVELKKNGQISKSTIDKLNKEKNDLINDKSLIKSSIDSFKSEINSLKKQNEDFKLQISNLPNQDETKNQINILNERISQLNKEYSEKENKLNEIINYQNQEIKDLENIKSQLENKLQNQSSNNEELDELKKQNENLKLEKDINSKAVSDLSISIQKNKNIISELEENVSNKDSQINSLNSKIKENSSLISELNEKVKQFLSENKVNDLVKDEVSCVDDIKKSIKRYNTAKKEIKKLLVVDDSLIIISLMKKNLEAFGYQVQTVNSGLKAVELMKKEIFDLVITDINMPEMNGIELFLWIKETRPDCRVIMMTAFSSPEIKEFVSHQKSIKYFEKPVKIDELKAFMDNYNSNVSDSQDITLFDFVQMNIVSKSQKIIVVNDPVTKSIGRIYILFGEIVHAECGELSGIEAFNRIVAMSKSLFSEEKWSEPTTKTINDKASKLFKDSVEKIEANKKLIDEFNKTIDIFTNKLDINHLDELYRKYPEKFVIRDNGLVFDIEINKSTKQDVINAMTKYSSSDYSNNQDQKIFMYNDLSFAVSFGDNGLVNNLYFGHYYPGATENVLYIGDKASKARQLYGLPEYSSENGVLWNRLSVICESGNTIKAMKVS